jgi:hypothetical protein
VLTQCLYFQVEDSEVTSSNLTRQSILC